MYFGLRESSENTQYHAFPILSSHTDRGKDCAVSR
jgi:hypothetical protein